MNGCFRLLSRGLIGIVSIFGSATTMAEAPRQERNVVYGEAHGVGLIMDIFTPVGDRNGLAVVDVVSGGWDAGRGKIRDHERAQVFQILCDRGYTVFAIRPGSLSRFSIPDMKAHMERGIVWVKEHADQYGIDPDRLGLMGASAGGHLASLVAVTNGRSSGDADRNRATVKAVAVFFPPTDFLDYGQGPGSGERIRQIALRGDAGGLTEDQIRDRLVEISPARQVTPQAPPFLLIHGTADEVVPLRQSELLQTALQDQGVSADLIVKEGGGHPWPTIHEEVAVIADWFDRQLPPASQE